MKHSQAPSTTTLQDEARTPELTPEVNLVPNSGLRGPFPIGTKLGKYELIEVVGRGNMGTVYRAHDPFSSREVAIKVCSAARIESETEQRLYRRLFFNEAHTAGALHHPNILTVYDAGEDQEIPYIVMEYLANGETLEPYCASEMLLPWEAVVEIVYQCAKALDYAHRRGVVHRDIKPSNIMLTENSQVKIGDFGIAERAQSDATQVLGVIGSPKYMAPEQIREEDLTGPSDAYSLGVVLFELLTGRSPYRTDSLTGLMRSILTETPPSVCDLRPSLPPAVASIVSRALGKALDERYTSGAELAADLAALIEGDDGRADIGEDQKFSELRRCSFFNDFSDPELWEVIRACQWNTYPLRTEIITEGSLESAFFVLVSGAVAVTKGGAQITTLDHGDCFGEMGYLAQTERSASIVAQEDVVLLKINAGLMEGASLPCQLRFNKHFLTTLIKRLARTSAALSRRDRAAS